MMGFSAVTGKGESSSEEFEQIFSDWMPMRRWLVRNAARLWRPPTDVYETAKAIVVRIEIAGMRSEEFRISFEEKTLVVEGTRQDRSSKVGYHQMEIAYGNFETKVVVNIPIDVDKIEASYENGFLEITLPKAPIKKVVINSD
jgi:HSP20 family protein